MSSLSLKVVLLNRLEPAPEGEGIGCSKPQREKGLAVAARRERGSGCVSTEETEQLRVGGEGVTDSHDLVVVGGRGAAEQDGTALPPFQQVFP